MQNFCQIIICVFIVTGFNSCNLSSREVKCKDFDKTLLEWIPYKQDDTLYFIDNFNKEYKLVVNKTWLEHATSYNTNNDCGECEDTWGVDISGDSGNNRITIESRRHNQGNPSERLIMSIADKNLYFNNETFIVEFKDSIDINGHTFYDVKVVSSLVDSKKVIFSRNYGLIMIKFDDFELYSFNSLLHDAINLQSYNYQEIDCK